MKEDIKPCPFCGSTDLVEGSWYLDDTGADYEVEAWECNSCKAGAPKRIWNQRRESAVEWLHAAN